MLLVNNFRLLLQYIDFIEKSAGNMNLQPVGCEIMAGRLIISVPMDIHTHQQDNITAEDRSEEDSRARTLRNFLFIAPFRNESLISHNLYYVKL